VLKNWNKKMNITFVVNANPVSNMTKLVDSYEKIKRNKYDDSAFLIYNLNMLEYNGNFLSDQGILLLCNPTIGILLNELNPLNQENVLTLSLYFSICYEITNEFCKFAMQFEKSVPAILQSLISVENGERASRLCKTYYIILMHMLTFLINKEKYYIQRKAMFA
jgi:hypothetical protein